MQQQQSEWCVWDNNATTVVAGKMKAVDIIKSRLFIH